MLAFNEARQKLIDQVSACHRMELCSVYEIYGRILANDVIAPINLPITDNSAMDGYAIHLQDWQAQKPLPIQQICYAGVAPEPLKPGHATRVFTGSLIPEGADTVVVQENCCLIKNQVWIQKPPGVDQHIRKQGEDIHRGESIFCKGRQMTPMDAGLLAAVGMTEIPVFSRIKVGLLSTGNELREPGQALAEHQVYNSNSVMLQGALIQLGCEVVTRLHAQDDECSIQTCLEQLREKCDLIISIGGVSAGDKDLVKTVIEQLGELTLWKVNMKPGKPLAMGHINQTPVVCLPGNPVSAFVTFILLAAPMIRKLQGCSTLMPETEHYPIRLGRSRQSSREEFVRVQKTVSTNDEPCCLEFFPNQGSAILSSLTWATGLARLPANTCITNGYRVEYYNFANWLC